jgi:glycosyltransferase involved in cell wall biosynthesis
VASEVIWRGPLHDASGYAQEGREFVLGLDAMGAHVRAEDVPLGPNTGPLEPTIEARLQELAELPVGDEAVRVEHGPPSRWARGARVGRTAFATDRIPPDWVPVCNAVDEVWVPSRFNLETFAAAGVEVERLRVVPNPIRVDRWTGEDRLEPAPGRFSFLSVLDWTLAQGWDVLLRAYCAEFAGQEDVELVLRVRAAYGQTPHGLRQTIDAFVGRGAPPIVVLDHVLPARELPRLYRSADCFVLPTRGEAWGRAFLEAMAAGLPVIATAWGGQTEFLDEDNSYPISIKGLVRVPEPGVQEAPAYRGHRWAEPSVEHLQELMRRAYERPDERRAKAERGGEAVREHDTEAVCSRLFLRLAGAAAY